MALVSPLPGVSWRAFDANGDPVSGANMRWYLQHTTTPVPFYSDEAMTTPHPVPLPANAAGGYAPVYLPAGFYKVDITDPDTAASLPGFPQDDIAVGLATDFPDDLAALLASTDSMTVGTHVVTVAEGYRYEVVSSSGDITTAGGAELDVVPVHGVYHVGAFGALTSDNKAICEAAAAALPSTGGALAFPAGDFYIGSEVDFDVPEDTTIHAHGTRFVCTHDGVAFDLNSPWDATTHAGTDTETKRRVRWLGGEFTNSAGTKTASVAIKAQAMRQFAVEDVYIEGFWAGIRFAGKDSYHFNRCYSYNCDYHYYNPATVTVAADKTQVVSWTDCHASAASSTNVVCMADPLANIVWRGGSINNPGSGPAMRFEDSALVLSEGFKVDGLHSEQLDASGSIHFHHNDTGDGDSFDGAGFHSVHITGGSKFGSGSAGWKGILLEKVLGAKIEASVFRDASGGATEEAIIIDSDCTKVVVDFDSTQFLSVATPIAVQDAADWANVHRIGGDYALGGSRQTWHNETPSRSAGTAYQNTNGGPIQVFVTQAQASDYAFQVSPDGTTWETVTDINDAIVSVIVPDRHWYRAETGFTIVKWLELK